MTFRYDVSKSATDVPIVQDDVYNKPTLKHTGKSLSANDLMVKQSDLGKYTILIKKGIPTKTANRITAKAHPPQTKNNVKRRNASLSDIGEEEVKEVSVILKCLSRAVWYEIKYNESDPGLISDVFVEAPSVLPNMSTIEDFFTQIFNCKDLSVECAVTTAAYLDRLKMISQVKLLSSTWRRICFISVLEADKVLRDKLVWNEDYKDIHVGIDLDVIRKLERAFLKYIEYSLTLSQTDYASYKFDLLSLRENQTDTSTFEKRQGFLRSRYSLPRSK
jgi:hypothetical protein